MPVRPTEINCWWFYYRSPRQPASGPVKSCSLTPGLWGPSGITPTCASGLQHVGDGGTRAGPASAPRCSAGGSTMGPRRCWQRCHSSESHSSGSSLEEDGIWKPLTGRSVLSWPPLLPPDLHREDRPSAPQPGLFSGAPSAALVLYQSKHRSVCVSPWLSPPTTRCDGWQLSSRFCSSTFSSVSVSLLLLLPVPLSLLAFSVMVGLKFGVSMCFLQLIIFPPLCCVTVFSSLGLPGCTKPLEIMEAHFCPERG